MAIIQGYRKNLRILRPWPHPDAEPVGKPVGALVIGDEPGSVLELYEFYGLEHVEFVVDELLAATGDDEKYRHGAQETGC